MGLGDKRDFGRTPLVPGFCLVLLSRLRQGQRVAVAVAIAVATAVAAAAAAMAAEGAKQRERQGIWGVVRLVGEGWDQERTLV